MTEDLAKLLKKLDIIYRGPVLLKNAKGADFYIDVKKAYGSSEALNLISKKLYELIDKRATCIAASGHGGIPPASVIASKYGLKLTIIREQPKNYGMQTDIDGHIPNMGDRISIIDDVFTTGRSLRKIIEILKPTKAEILGCFVVVKRGYGGLPVPLEHLLTSDDLF